MDRYESIVHDVCFGDEIKEALNGVRGSRGLMVRRLLGMRDVLGSNTLGTKNFVLVLSVLSLPLV